MSSMSPICRTLGDLESTALPLFAVAGRSAYAPWLIGGAGGLRGTFGPRVQ
jgi:hypothetical protein